MTAGGWAMLIGSWAVIIGLNIFCFVRLFGERPAQSITEQEQSRP
jgi:hypothetical protein